MATESGRVKQVALASVAAIVSVAGSNHIWWLPLAGILLTFAFWYLDARYLSQERWFRDIYEDERKQESEVTFVMTPAAEFRKKHPMWKSMIGWSAATLYGILIATGLATSAALFVTADQTSANNAQVPPTQRNH